MSMIYSPSKDKMIDTDFDEMPKEDIEREAAIRICAAIMEVFKLSLNDLKSIEEKK